MWGAYPLSIGHIDGTSDPRWHVGSTNGDHIEQIHEPHSANGKWTAKRNLKMISNLNQIGFTSIKAKLLASFSLIIIMLIAHAFLQGRILDRDTTNAGIGFPGLLRRPVHHVIIALVR